MNRAQRRKSGNRVAPLAGAWIEMYFAGIRILYLKSSLPSRERGLKYENPNKGLDLKLSLPSRERGLKLCIEKELKYNHCVAPLAGAWIEITVPWSHLPHLLSLPSRERGLKYRQHQKLNCIALSLPSRERGLKLQSLHKRRTVLPCRSPRGSVD